MSGLEVKDIMTVDVVTLEESDDLDIADEAMRMARIHHLPVVRNGKLVGIVTRDDILRAQVSVFAELTPSQEWRFKRSIRASQVMSREVVTVAPETPAADAAQLLRRHKYGCLPVVEDGELVGIVTEGDFLDLVIRALNDDRPHAAPAHETRAH